MRLQRRLLFAAWGTWRLPRFRALGDALVAEHGHRLPTEAYLDVLTSSEPAHAAEVVAANLPRVLRRRGASDARRILDVLVRPAPAEPSDG